MGAGLLKYVQDPVSREKITRYEERQEVMPKMLNYDVSGALVDRALKTTWATLNGEVKNECAVPCRVFNLTAAVAPPVDILQEMPILERKEVFKKTQATALGVVQELEKLGVKVALRTRMCYVNGAKDKAIEQSILCLPHFIIVGSGHHATRTRDLESAKLFLAYLMDRGWVLESELPAQDVVEGKPVDAPFSAALLKFSKEPAIQQKLQAFKASLPKENNAA